MPIFALVELELHGLPEFEIGEIAQDVLGFDDMLKVGKRLGQPVRRKAVGQSLNDYMRGGSALLKRDSTTRIISSHCSLTTLRSAIFVSNDVNTP